MDFHLPPLRPDGLCSQPFRDCCAHSRYSSQRWSRFQPGKPKGKVNFVLIINVQVRVNVSFRAFQTNLQVPGTQTVATWKNDWPSKKTRPFLRGPFNVTVTPKNSRRLLFLREPQHTPGAYPWHPQTPKNSFINCWLRVWGMLDNS